MLVHELSQMVTLDADTRSWRQRAQFAEFVRPIEMDELMNFQSTHPSDPTLFNRTCEQVFVRVCFDLCCRFIAFYIQPFSTYFHRPHFGGAKQWG